MRAAAAAAQLSQLSCPRRLPLHERGHPDSGGPSLVEHTARGVCGAVEAVDSVDRVLERRGAEKDCEHVGPVRHVEHTHQVGQPLLRLGQRAPRGGQLPARRRALRSRTVRRDSMPASAASARQSLDSRAKSSSRACCSAAPSSAPRARSVSGSWASPPAGSPSNAPTTSSIASRAAGSFRCTAE